MSAMKKKIVEIKTGDELMAAMNDVYSTPFGNVGQHIHYVVKDEKVLTNARLWEDWEIAQYVRHATEHPRSRLDVSAIAGGGHSLVVDSGKWNYETGKMEHPGTSIKTGNRSESPSLPAMSGWTLLSTFLMLTWTPFHWWLETKGYLVAFWWSCYPTFFFFVMIGVTHFIARMQGGQDG